MTKRIEACLLIIWTLISIGYMIRTMAKLSSQSMFKLIRLTTIIKKIYGPKILLMTSDIKTVWSIVRPKVVRLVVGRR